MLDSGARLERNAAGPPARRPADPASDYRGESTAGRAAPPGGGKPGASDMLAIVGAVPMVMQCPAERLMQDSASR